jgi:hypothetical protein
MMRSPVRRAATAAIDIKAAAKDRGDVETHPSTMPGDDSDVAASTAVPFSYSSDYGLMRYWDGRQWTEHRSAAQGIDRDNRQRDRFLPAAGPRVQSLQGESRQNAVEQGHRCVRIGLGAQLHPDLFRHRDVAFRVGQQRSIDAVILLALLIRFRAPLDEPFYTWRLDVAESRRATNSSGDFTV